MKKFISIITTLCMLSSSLVFSAPADTQESGNGEQTKVMIADNFDEFSDFSSQLISLDNSDSFSKGLTITAGEPILKETHQLILKMMCLKIVRKILKYTVTMIQNGLTFPMVIGTAIL